MMERAKFFADSNREQGVYKVLGQILHPGRGFWTILCVRNKLLTQISHCWLGRDPAAPGSFHSHSECGVVGATTSASFTGDSFFMEKNTFSR